VERLATLGSEHLKVVSKLEKSTETDANFSSLFCSKTGLEPTVSERKWVADNSAYIAVIVVCIDSPINNADLFDPGPLSVSKWFDCFAIVSNH
jgi:hypothetical protein